MTDISRSTGGTIITTGAGSGLGTATALKLISGSTSDIHNIFTVRPSQDTSSATYVSLKQAIADSKNASKNEILHLALDDFSSVRAFAADINARIASGALPRIKVLILNAGVQHTADLKTTKDGYELTFQVNYLANFLLVSLLLPSFAGTDANGNTSDTSSPGRIVLISSDSHDPERGAGYPPQHWPTNDAEFSDLFKPKAIPPEMTAYNFGMSRYALSKVCFAMFMFSLQRHFDASSVYSRLETVSIDPGWVATNIIKGDSAMLRYGVKPFLKIGPYIGRFMGEIGKQLKTADSSSDDIVKYAVGDLKGEKPKAWYIIHGAIGSASTLAQDKVQQEILWEKSVELLGLESTSIPGLELKAM